MASSFKLPDLGEGLTEGEVARWLVAEGQEIAEDDPLVEIQTDKATVEIPSPYGGTVLRILVAEGEIAPVGTELVLIGALGEVVPEPASTSPLQGVPSDAAQGRVQATPVVRRVAQELGVDLVMLAGSGPGGRITEDDVRAAAAGAQGGRREPLRGVRRAIAEHMTRAHREVPPVTWVEECDLEGVPLDRLLPVVVKACTDALVEFPELNARLDGDAILYLDRYDIGVAVQTDDGLVVPVIRAADEKSVDELATAIAALAELTAANPLNATALPAGWAGYGSIDPFSLEPTLPPGVTFADVLSGVDELAFTTTAPGFNSTIRNYDFGVDNIRLLAVPEPVGLLMGGLGAGLLVVLWGSRFRSRG